jgi:cobalt-zinc-cadmium efflux system outer membrane protein
LPLPLFDRNQGGIEEARAGALRAESERRSTEVRLLTELARSVAIVAAAREESATLEEVILPHQSRTFENLRSGFREGRFNYLEVLDAQRTLVETRSQRVRALADYHQAVATIQWLTGRPLTAGLQEARSEQGSPQ